MLNGGNTDVSVGNDGASRSVDHTVGESGDNRLAGKIGTLYLQAMAYGCGKEGHRELKSGVQPFAAQREWGKKSMLHVGLGWGIR